MPEHSRCELSTGTVLLTVPLSMTADDVADLRAWLLLIITRHERLHLGTGSESATGPGQCDTPSPARELSGGPFDEEELDPHGECAAELTRLNTLLKASESLKAGYLDEVEKLRGADQRLRTALKRVRQELWVDFCLKHGRTDMSPAPFNAKPHISLIDDALADGELGKVTDGKADR